MVYSWRMSRGWESKDVASRQEDALNAVPGPTLSIEELELRARLHSLELDQKRLERELAEARHPRHASMVQAALNHIAEQLSIVKNSTPEQR